MISRFIDQQICDLLDSEPAYNNIEMHRPDLVVIQPLCL